MSLALINETTVMQFVENEKLFDNCVTKFFEALVVDQDGMLTQDELRAGFRNLLGYEYMDVAIYDDFYKRFDEDQDGRIGRKVFGSLMKEVMLAMARGIGKSPVMVALALDSFLAKAVELELE